MQCTVYIYRHQCAQYYGMLISAVYCVYTGISVMLLQYIYVHCPVQCTVYIYRYQCAQYYGMLISGVYCVYTGISVMLLQYIYMSIVLCSVRSIMVCSSVEYTVYILVYVCEVITVNMFTVQYIVYIQVSVSKCNSLFEVIIGSILCEVIAECSPV